MDYVVILDGVLFFFRGKDDTVHEGFITFVSTLMKNARDRRKLYERLVENLSMCCINAAAVSQTDPEGCEETADTALRSLKYIYETYGKIYDPTRELVSFTRVESGM